MAVAYGRTEMVRYFLDQYAERLDRRLQLRLMIAAAATNRIKILEMLDKRGFPMLDVDDAGIGAGKQVDILLWMHFVEGFTRRKLTYSTDILHAISGLADFMATAARTEYLCGLWRRELNEFLLWYLDSTHELGGKHPPLLAPRPFRSELTYSPFSPMGYRHKRAYPVSPRRHASYHAPSWSWASVIGPIGFLLGRLDTAAGDQLFHVRKDGALAQSKTRASLLENVDMHYTMDSLTPFGPPKR